MNEHDEVAGFCYEVFTVDGCQLTRRYQVGDAKAGSVRALPHEGWRPMAPTGVVNQATLTTVYGSGKQLCIEIDGDEHVELSDNGGFDKMLSSIARGNMPGEALKRQLTKAFALPKLPKIKRPKMA